MFSNSQICFNDLLTCHAKNKSNRYKAIVCNALGNIGVKLQNVQNTRNYSTSETYYQEAINYDKSFLFPYNGLGNIFRENHDYASAIEKYSEATKNENFMWPWNYLGDCFRYLEKYKIAMRCYNKAIDICRKSKDKTIIYPLYGKGRIYYELGNRNNNNEKYFNKAIDIFNDTKKHLTNLPPLMRFVYKDLAQAYQKVERFEDAIKTYQLIIDENLFGTQNYYIGLIKSGIGKCESNIALARSCEMESDDPARIVMCEINRQGFDKRAFDKKESFEVNFLRREKMTPEDYNRINISCKNNNLLHKYIQESEKKIIGTEIEILRRWNSYTPIITNGKGGGYFFKTDNTGIVLDPGHDFMKNFKNAGHSFSEIDIILITHAHDDHTADLESILNLQYRYNKLLKSTVLKRDFAKERKISTSDIEENKLYKDTIDERYNKSKKKLVLYTSKGVYLKYSGMLNHNKNFQVHLSDLEYNSIKNMDKEIYLMQLDKGEKVSINGSAVIHAIMAIHTDLFDNCACLGYTIETDDLIFVYTGDTSWCDKDGNTLEAQYKEIVQRKKPTQKIILLAHLGGFKEQENNYIINSKDDKNVYYENHLGRLGLVKIVSSLQPDICLISEFGEEFNGLRVEISNIFNKAFKETLFFPADIGLHMVFSSTEVNPAPLIKVISNIDTKNRIIEYENVAPEFVSVGEYRYNNSLFYYKKDGHFTENDCIQAFIDRYSEDRPMEETDLKLEF